MSSKILIYHHNENFYFFIDFSFFFIKFLTEFFVADLKRIKQFD